jgi:hypothetical protein
MAGLRTPKILKSRQGRREDRFRIGNDPDENAKPDICQYDSMTFAKNVPVMNASPEPGLKDVAY